MTDGPFARIGFPLLALIAIGALLTVYLRSSSGSSFNAIARSAAATGHSKFLVVAGENVWGSIAGQLAGDKATVVSLIASPGTDPHSYQPTAQDERTLAEANMAIVNGLGYDAWMAQGLRANRFPGRLVLRVGDLLGLPTGSNPHQWYSPASVHRVADAIAAAYSKLDPADRGYFARRRRSFETRGLAQYDRLRAEIRSRYSGTPVGYSESIFQPLGEDLRLKLLTPGGFAKAIAEGTEVSARDKGIVDAQAQHRQIKVWIYNSQNVTPDVQRVTAIARARRIPITSLTETLSPASDSFQQWQVTVLTRLLATLHRATGR